MVKKRRTCLILTILLIICSIGSVGCKKESDNILSGKEKEDILGENEYLLYYLDEDKMSLKSEKIKYEAGKNPAKTAQYFIEKINELMVRGMKDTSVQINLKDVSISNNIAVLDMDKEYLEIQTVTEILLRACMVLTLTQIEEINYLSLTVNGQALKDESGNVINMMKAEDFVNFKDNYPYTEKEVKVVLYFANSTGNKLKKKEIKDYYDYTVSYEEFIINKLIEGVSEKDADRGYKSVLSKNTVLDMVYTKNGVCYVDFNESIMNTVSPVSTELMLYSIVNSLSELPYITKIQFSVGGENDIKLHSDYSLSKPFSRNLDLVIKEGEEDK